MNSAPILLPRGPRDQYQEHPSSQTARLINYVLNIMFLAKMYSYELLDEGVCKLTFPYKEGYVG